MKMEEEWSQESKKGTASGKRMVCGKEPQHVGKKVKEESDAKRDSGKEPQQVGKKVKRESKVRENPKGIESLSQIALTKFRR